MEDDAMNNQTRCVKTAPMGDPPQVTAEQFGRVLRDAADNYNREKGRRMESVNLANLVVGFWRVLSRPIDRFRIGGRWQFFFSEVCRLVLR